jgi:fructokinase
MNFKVVGIGEALWDLLPGGRQMGGAPANFACHAHALGAEARVVSRVGDDPLGHEIIAQLQDRSVRTDCIEVDRAAPTGTVTVEVGAGGEPRYVIHENVAWDHLIGETASRVAAAEADAVCFGTLAQRNEPSRSTIRSLVAATAPGALRILDVNLRQHYYSKAILEESLALANVLKINESELPRLAELFALSGDVRTQISRLAERHALRVVAYTRGGRGSLLLAYGRWSDHPGVPVTVADTVGAGDAFTAAMTLGVLANWDLDLINQCANEVAAYVASCKGATPPLPEGLAAAFRADPSFGRIGKPQSRSTS